MNTAELSGISFVGVGAFNPAIVHPSWLAEKSLIPRELAERVLDKGEKSELIVSPQLASFVADWLTVQVTQRQLILATVELGRGRDLRDLAAGFFQLLPETPIDAIGLNADSHYKVATEADWHAFGDKFVPKPFWEELFSGELWQERPDGKHAGMRSLTVEARRADPEFPGYVRVELAPSIRILPFGIYISVNAHFDLTQRDRKGNGADAARTLRDQWDRTRSLQSSILSKITV